MIKAFAILFADNYRQDDLHGLVRSRTLASLPVGSRYRLVDFMLSSLVKAGIDNIGILTNHNYKSLRDHVGWGKDWDLNRKNSGLTLITPLSNYLSNRIPQNKIEALVNTMVYTENLSEEYCILADTNIIGNIDFKEMFQYHVDTGSDITVAYHYRKPEIGESQIIFDKDYKVYETLYHFNGGNEKCATQAKIYIMTKELLNAIIKKGMTLGWEDILRDYVSKNLDTLNVYAYEIKGYSKVINSVKDYFDFNQDLLKPETLTAVFDSGVEILTRVQDSVPTHYGENSKVKRSLLGDGSYINGTVENSIIFRDVIIEEGAVVKNSIIMADSIIKKGAKLNYVITDKSIVVPEEKELSGTSECQVIVEKNKCV